MGTLLLRLSGPLQAWGADSRFTERKTRHEPTKSGVVGLLAASLGRTREEDVSDLAAFPIAIRIDQPGRYERDFQTARTRKFNKATQTWVADKSLPLSNRYYLADAVFVVGIQMPDEKISLMSKALTHPAFPLYLGRRSCPPSGKVLFDTCEGVSLLDALRAVSWQASERSLLYQKREETLVVCEVLRDVLPDDGGELLSEVVWDYPLSFSQRHRRYEPRPVVHDSMEVNNPYCVKSLRVQSHDPISAIEGV